jgi:phage baseplate assembly protein W
MPALNKKFTDFDIDFLPHPISGDIVTLSDVAAVKRSIKNLILSGRYERPYRENLGSGIAQLLFENINPLTQQQVKDAILDTIRNGEPRARVLEVVVSVSPDENGYNTRITFSVDTASEIATVDMFLERIRG